nr:hypothetical protein [Anaerolineaceae bacterium]
MKVYGHASISDLLGDGLVYRSLEPLDRHLPGLTEIRQRLGLPSDFIPRKAMPQYAMVIFEILNDLAGLNGSIKPIKNVIVLGDSRLNDGNAFFNLCELGDMKGFAFIGSENTEKPQITIEDINNNKLYLANRWNALFEFMQIVEDADFPINE